MWKTIKDYPNYEVSDKGEVRSKDRIALRKGEFVKLKGKTLKPSLANNYLRVTLYNGDRHNFCQVFIHRLVAMAFIDNPDNLPYVNHKDENPRNNNVDNLEWCTAKYNSNYGTAIVRRVIHQNWENIADKQSIPVIQKSKDMVVVGRYKSVSDAGRKNNYNIASISKCCRGLLKTYKGYIWEFTDKEVVL